MAIIKPISDLRNKSNEISQLVHESHEPVYITKNGAGDMVLMSIEHYRTLKSKLDMFSKLSVAQAQLASGVKHKTLSEVSVIIRKRLREKNA